MRRAILDTNIYVDWLNGGLHEDLVVGPGRLRILSAVVLMELRIGATTAGALGALGQVERAFTKAQRLAAPTGPLFSEAGRVLSSLRAQGREVRRASLVHDTLIALTARQLGATVFTRDASDFLAIRKICEFSLEVVA